VGLQQPIFTGFRLRSNARAAEYLATAATYDNRNDASELDLNIISAYWTLYQTLQTRTFVDENVTRLTNYQQDTERLMNVGMATRNDLLKIQVQLSSARLTQIDAANDVRLAMMNLNNIIGQQLETEVQLASQPAGIEEPQGRPITEGEVGFGNLVGKALEARPDLQAIRFRVQAAEASVSAAKGGWWPQLFLGANYYYARPNSRYLPARDEFKPTWDVGVTLQFDLWNWGATSYQTEQASAQFHQSELLYEQMKDNISLEVTRATLNVDRARKKVAVAQLAIEQADENVRITNDKYKNGLATSSDLLDADVALLQAKTSLSASQVEYTLALARLDKATGQGSFGAR
jgi:outer membrane protein TolC